MADSALKLSGNFEAGKNYLVKGETLLAWRKALVADRVVAGPNLKETQTPQGRVFTAQAGGGAAGTTGGSFCTLFQVGDDWFIRGGFVSAGDKNFNVPDYAVTVTGDPPPKLVYMDVPVEAYMDDDNSYLFSGIKTSSASSLEMEDTSSDDYPDNDDPAVPSGTGTLILPVGSVVVTDGVPSFNATGCGPFFAKHCGGSLSYARA